MSRPPLAGRAAVSRKALGDALALPAFLLFFTMAGFGSLMQSAGFGADMAAAATLLIWGLPGQLAMVELTLNGQGVAAAIFACSLANARFMPMVVAFLPAMSRAGASLPRQLLDAQMLSINSWAMCLREFPRIDAPWRHRYYRVFAATILAAAVFGTLGGYYGALLLPAAAVLGLIFASPLFFALVLADTRGRGERLSMLCGCVLIALLHPLLPQFDLLLTGLLGGSAGFLLARRGGLSGSLPRAGGDLADTVNLSVRDPRLRGDDGKGRGDDGKGRGDDGKGRGDDR